MRNLTLTNNSCLRLAEAILHLETASTAPLQFTVRGRLRWAAMRKNIFEPVERFGEMVRGQAAKEGVKDQAGFKRIQKEIGEQLRDEKVELALGEPLLESMILDVPSDPASLQALSLLMGVMIDPEIHADTDQQIDGVIREGIRPVPPAPFPTLPMHSADPEPAAAATA